MEPMNGRLECCEIDIEVSKRNCQKVLMSFKWKSNARYICRC